jgi:anti-sigma factor RsiW
MTTMHEEWTDKLSDYLDGELTQEERRAVESHLAACPSCAAVLDDLKRVVARAQALEPRPPHADLWAGVAERIDARRPGVVADFRPRTRRTFAFTLPQLAAAAALVMAVSGSIVWLAVGRPDGVRKDATYASQPAPAAQSLRAAPPSGASPDASPSVATVSFADAQYDAAVAELERAVQKGRGRLDASTIAIVQHNLEIIDQAIEQARQALASDPANSYLSGHLVEARRRKLDLLRRTAALTTESD